MLVWLESRQRCKRYIISSKIFTYWSPLVTLKTRSRSPKSNQLLSLSQWYIHASLMIFHPLVQEILCIQESIMPTPTPTKKINSMRPPVTLKMGSESPKLNQLFGLSQWCIHASLVKFHLLIQEIWWIQTVTLKPTSGICTEINMSPLTFSGGT